MAESCPVAFGRYLRALRERRSLSLNDVASLSSSFADPIAKSYLSRCENGHQALAFSKMIALSRIYEVPSDVLVERLELDMELDKVGGPDTNGLDYETLSLKGKEHIDKGELWQSYACFRDAIAVAPSSPLVERLRDHSEQLHCAFLSLGSAAAKLGCFRLALHEFEYIRTNGGLSPRLVPIVLERLARTYRALGQLANAKECADTAIREAEAMELVQYLGYFYSARARIAEKERDLDYSILLYQRAYDSFRAAGYRSECATTLCNLANAYFQAKRARSARRALNAAERLARPLGQRRTCALVRILMGEIEDSDGRPHTAREHWREAALIAKQLGDKTIRFQAEFFLYKQALDSGDELASRALERRLRRACPWISKEIEEHLAFKQLAASRSTMRRRVSFTQR